MAAATTFLRSFRRRDVASASISAYRSLTTGSIKPVYVGHSTIGTFPILIEPPCFDTCESFDYSVRLNQWSSLSRTFSSRPAGTNSCVSVIEGKNSKVIENSEGARTTPFV
ncbi:heat shock protein 70 kDa, partial [Trifolium pratense]